MTPTPTVREVLRLALPLGSRVLAGALGLERPVRRARVGGVLSPIFPQLESDELAILDLPRVQQSNPGLTTARIVRELNRLGIAALAVVGPVERAAQREADRANLPLLELPEGSDVAQSARAVQRLLADTEAQVEVQAAALYRRLAEGVAAGEGVERLVAMLHELTGHAVRLTDVRASLLATAGNEPLGAVRHEQPLRAGEGVVGTLTLISPADLFDDFSRIALVQGAAALALEVVKQEAVQAARSGAALGLALSLLSGADEATVRTAARAEQYPLDEWQWAVLGVVRAAPDAEVAQWARRGAEHASTLGWQVAHHAQRSDEGWQVLWLLAGGEEWGSRQRALLQALRQMWHGVPSLSVAAGDPQQGLEGLRRSVAEAQDALALGRRLLGEGQTHLHREMGIYRLLRHVQATEDAAQFVVGTLGALREYDAEHGGALLPTLESLLAEGGNVSATAKALHLHRNSLAYRVERIRTISGLDPTTPQDAFTFRLALLLAPLVE